MRVEPAVVEARGVGKRYGRVVALREASVVVRCGEVLGIQGANGSGKSTLLGILGGALKPTWGSVVGVERGEFGWAAHDAWLYREGTGESHLEAMRRAHRLSAADVSGVRERLQVGRFAERPVRTYSRGQRQRVVLALAILHRPRALFLDEPSTGLDGGGVALLEQVVAEERARGAAVVMVSHDAGVVRRLATRVLRVEAGRVVAEVGNPEEEAEGFT